MAVWPIERPSARRDYVIRWTPAVLLRRGCWRDQLILLLKTLAPLIVRCDSISFRVVVSSSALSKQDSLCRVAGVGSCVDLQLSGGL